MGKLTELEQWDEDVYQIETSDPVLGGPEGITNKPAKQLANRTQWLKKRLEDANNALAEHEKSRNHPDATLTDKGFVKLYSGVTSLDETMAATPKAVKIAMDNANERLAKARNLADLQSVPLALNNLTLTNVKKAVEDTHLGLDKLPTFRPESEDDLDALPAGFIGECKNKTIGGPLPTEQWCYIHKAGNLDNYSNNPKRKGGVIWLACIWDLSKVWTGVKFDDGSTTTEKYTWARDYNTLYKPTPKDIGALAKDQNGADIPDKPGFIKNLGLTETVNRARNAVQKTGDTMTGNLSLQSNNRMYYFIQNTDGSVRASIWKDKGGDGIHISNGADGGGDFIFGKNGEFRSPTNLYAGSAIFQTNGNLYGTTWNGYLSNWLNNAFATRDNNINTRATIDWTKQYFLQDVRLGLTEMLIHSITGSNEVHGGYVMTGLIFTKTNNLLDYLYQAPVQKNINGIWYNVVKAKL
ncbi:TPA: tail fiber protein [Salmonella enterica subsp. enterica serovar Java]